MTATATNISSSSFEKFINSRKLCVLFSYNGIGFGFNKYLKQQLEKKYKSLVATGTQDLSKVDYKSAKISDFVKTWIPNIGLPPTNSIYPGYYLFKDGVLVAYHPGTMDPKYADPKVDGFITLFNATVALLIGIFEKDAKKGFQFFVEGILATNGLKVFQFFEQSLKEKNSNYSRAKQQTVYEDELSKAYKILGVQPNASDEEIKRSWKRMIKEHHPDKSQKDKEARTKLSAEINNAYQLIKTSREKEKKQKSAA